MSRWKRMPEGAPRAEPKDVASVAVERISVPSNNGVPNHPALPALLYRAAFTAPKVDPVKALYEANGWFNVWDWHVFDFHHFHSNAHEALTVTSGIARLHLGGDEGPVLEVAPGDVLILPAGFGHRSVQRSDDFRVVGGYPSGQEERNLLRADPDGLERHLETVCSVPARVPCPVYADGGPLVAVWSSSGTKSSGGAS